MMMNDSDVVYQALSLQGSPLVKCTTRKKKKLYKANTPYKPRNDTNATYTHNQAPATTNRKKSKRTRHCPSTPTKTLHTSHRPSTPAPNTSNMEEQPMGAELGALHTSTKKNLTIKLQKPMKTIVINTKQHQAFYV
jgi:hypothetical protein